MSRIGNSEWGKRSIIDDDYSSEEDESSPLDDDYIPEEYRDEEWWREIYPYADPRTGAGRAERLGALRPVENRAVRPHHGADAGRAERG